MTKIRLWLIATHVFYAACSHASDKDAYEYLPQIGIPGVRRIIGEYARNLLTYKVKSFINLSFGYNGTDEPLPGATVTTVPFHDRKHTLVVTPEDKQQPALLVTYEAYENNSSNPPLIPYALQTSASTLPSDRTYQQTYTPLVRFKKFKTQQGTDCLWVIFPRLDYFRGYGGNMGSKYDWLDAAIDDKEKRANEALKQARFVFEEV